MVKLLLIYIIIFCSNNCYSQLVKNNNPIINKDSIFIGTTKMPVIVSSKLTIKIYPNPAINKISLQVTGFKPGLVMVKILDDKGILYTNDNRLLTTSEDEIAMFLQLKRGVYFVIISQQNKSVRKKLMVL